MIVESANDHECQLEKSEVRELLHTIVDVIKMSLRIVRVVDNEWTTEAVAVLRRQMAVIPERP